MIQAHCMHLLEVTSVKQFLQLYLEFYGVSNIKNRVCCFVSIYLHTPCMKPYFVFYFATGFNETICSHKICFNNNCHMFHPSFLGEGFSWLCFLYLTTFLSCSSVSYNYTRKLQKTCQKFGSFTVVKIHIVAFWFITHVVW